MGGTHRHQHSCAACSQRQNAGQCAGLQRLPSNSGHGHPFHLNHYVAPTPSRPGGLFGHMAADLLSDERHILAQSWRASARRWLRSLKDAVSSRIGSMHGARAAVHGAQMTAPASISMPKGWTRVQKKAGEQCSPVRFSAGWRAVPRRSWRCARSWQASATWPAHCIADGRPAAHPGADRSPHAVDQLAHGLGRAQRDQAQGVIEQVQRRIGPQHQAGGPVEAAQGRQSRQSRMRDTGHGKR